MGRAGSSRRSARQIMIIPTSADGAFDKVGVGGVGQASVEAIACEDANAIDIGCGDFVLLLF